MSVFFKRVVDRPIAVLMLSLAAVLFGFLAYQQSPLSLMPPLSYPTLTILTHYTGAAPEEVELEITNQLEERLSTLEGLKSIRSRSLSGQSEITLELRWGSSLDQSLQRVYERLDRIELPKGVSAPQVLRYDPSLDPLIVLTLSADQFMVQAEPDPQLRLSNIRRYALDVLSPILYQIEGVAAVKVIGGDQAEIDVRLHYESLKRLGLSIADVSRSLQAAQVNQAGGLLHTEQGDILIRTLSEIKSIDHLKSIVIKRILAGQSNTEINGSRFENKDQAWVTLGDLAEVELSYAERTSWVQVNHEAAIKVQVYRQSESDMVALSQKIRQRLFQTQISPSHKAKAPRASSIDQIKEQETHRDHSALAVPHPKGLKAILVSDQAEFIEKALSEVNQAMITGALLAIFILYAFLSSWRQTLIIAVAIPLSVILSFIPLQLFEVSLNLMSLGGLALGVGMLVDNAVVVLESIYRYREQGYSIKKAAEYGAQEVGSAVFASTLTTIAVFAPVAFMEGFAGQVFRDLALTVVSALLASLLVALGIVPTLAAHLKEINKEEHSDSNPSQAVPYLRPNQWKVWRANWPTSASNISKIKHLLALPLYWLEGSLSLIALIILSFFTALFGLIYFIFGWPLRFLTAPLKWLARLTQSIYTYILSIYLRLLHLSMNVPYLLLLLVFLLSAFAYHLQKSIPRALLPDVNQGIVIAELEFPVGTSLAATQRRTQQWIQSILEIEQIERVDLTIGQDESEEQPGDRRGPHQARLAIALKKASFESELKTQLRHFATHEAGVKLSLSKPSLIQLNTPMRVILKGRQLKELARMENRIVDEMKKIEQLSDIEPTFGQGAPELKIEYDHAKLRYFNLTPLLLAEQIRDQLNGIESLELLWDGERLPLRLRAIYANQVDEANLLTLPVQSPQTGAQSLVLGSLVRFTPSEGPAEIRHVDGQRAAEIQAQVSAFELDLATQNLKKKFASLSLSPQLDLSIAGQEREMKESSRELSAVLLISLFLVFVVMATQFESLRLPLLIMGSVPLALIGVCGGLYFTQSPLSVVVFVGLITLGGLVVNNAIVFIDATQRLRLKHPTAPVRDILKQAGQQRLRPILMTTLTTLIALIPMLIGSGEGAELRAPLALTVVSGLSFSTILVLFIIPALYQVFIPNPHQDSSSM